MTATTRRYCRRHEGALLAGVCADLAQRLGWNVWALRAVAVLGLFIDALVTGLIYGALALVLPRLHRGAGTSAAGPDLTAPELGARNRRITELERRFRDLENETDR